MEFIKREENCEDVFLYSVYIVSVKGVSGRYRIHCERGSTIWNWVSRDCIELYNESNPIIPIPAKKETEQVGTFLKTLAKAERIISNFATDKLEIISDLLARLEKVEAELKQKESGSVFNTAKTPSDFIREIQESDNPDLEIEFHSKNRRELEIKIKFRPE